MCLSRGDSPNATIASSFVCSPGGTSVDSLSTRELLARFLKPLEIFTHLANVGFENEEIFIVFNLVVYFRVLFGNPKDLCA